MGNSDVLRVWIMGFALLLVIGFLALPLPSSLQIGLFNHIHFALLYILAVVSAVLLVEQVVQWVTGKRSATRPWVLLLAGAILTVGITHVLTARMSTIHIAGSYTRLLDENPWTVLKQYITEATFFDKLPAIAISGLIHAVLGAIVLVSELLRGLVTKKYDMAFFESVLFTSFVVGATSLIMFARNLSVRSAWRRNFDLVAPQIIQPGDIPTGVKARVLNVIQATIKVPLVILGISFALSVVVYVIYRLRQSQLQKVYEQ